MKCQPEHIQNQSKLLPIITVIIHAGQTSWLTLPTVRLRVTLDAKLNFRCSDFFFFWSIFGSLAVWFRPVKLPITLSKAIIGFHFFVMKLLVLFIL